MTLPFTCGSNDELMGAPLAALCARNRVLLLGQFISVLITCTGIFTQVLNQSYGVSSLRKCNPRPPRSLTCAPADCS
jgi:hypothetical protein